VGTTRAPPEDVPLLPEELLLDLLPLEEPLVDELPLDLLPLDVLPLELPPLDVLAEVPLLDNAAPVVPSAAPVVTGEEPPAPLQAARAASVGRAGCTRKLTPRGSRRSLAAAAA
jgi:hypothetical protein